jgi:hypothetical protein
MAKRKSVHVRKKRILRLEVHKHVHRRFAGIRSGRHGAARVTQDNNSAPSTPALSSSSYASMF